MFAGTVNATREAILRLAVRGLNNRIVDIEAVVDTGFNDELTLPSHIVAALGLVPESPAEVTLADNVVLQANYYRAIVTWDNRPRVLSVLEIEGVPLVGMDALWGSQLTLDAVSGGAVSITRLEGRR